MLHILHMWLERNFILPMCTGQTSVNDSLCGRIFHWFYTKEMLKVSVCISEYYCGMSVECLSLKIGSFFFFFLYRLLQPLVSEQNCNPCLARCVMSEQGVCIGAASRCHLLQAGWMLLNPLLMFPAWYSVTLQQWAHSWAFKKARYSCVQP